MERQSAGQNRQLRRCYQSGRLEDEIWAAVYEQVYPQRKRPLTAPAAVKTENDQRPTEAELARRA